MRLPTLSSIRLIWILPNKTNTEIACSISNHNPEAQGQFPKYRDLSYRWGDAKHTQLIYSRETGSKDNTWHV